MAEDALDTQIEEIETPEAPQPRRRAPNEDPVDFLESDESHIEAETDDNDEEDAGDDATKPLPEPQPEVKQKFHIKVDGVEEDLELTNEEITKSLQLAAASQKRFSEAKQIQRQATQFIHLLQTDPMKVLTNPKLGINFDELSQSYLYEKFQLANMTKEQREAHELKQELETLRNEKKSHAEAAEAADLQKQTTHYEERYNQEYGEALTLANLPDSPFVRQKTFKALSDALILAEQKGIKLYITT